MPESNSSDIRSYRERLAILKENSYKNQSNTDIEVIESFEILLGGCTRCSEEGKNLIIKAFLLAFESFHGMFIRSGEPYLSKLIKVARIVDREIGLDAKSIACALLQDITEDTDYTLDDIEMQFGGKIASIIEGLTRISGVIKDIPSVKAEHFRKVLLTISDDVRIILIKIATRLYNMRSMDSLPLSKKRRYRAKQYFYTRLLRNVWGYTQLKANLKTLP